MAFRSHYFVDISTVLNCACGQKKIPGLYCAALNLTDVMQGAGLNARALRDQLLLFGTGTGTQPFPVSFMGWDRDSEKLGPVGGMGLGLY